MVEYVSSSLFIYSGAGKELVSSAIQNDLGTEIKPIAIEQLREREQEYLSNGEHVVVCADLPVIKEVMQWAMQYNFSLGIVPLKTQPQVSSIYGLSQNFNESLSLALRNDPKDIDLILCNDQLMLFKARVGRMPLVDSPENTSKLEIVINGFRRLSALQLLPLTIKTKGKNNKELHTAASGCLIFATPEQTFASRLISHDSSFTDGLISMVVVAPISIFDYFRLMLRTLSRLKLTSTPDSIGFVKSPHIDLETEDDYAVYIDGQPTSNTPVSCQVVPAALKMNHGKDLVAEEKRSAPGSEKFVVSSLPAGKELQKARNKKVPFFTYASEDRFKELFIALRADARLDASYIVLMVLSTLLATVGLYMNSSSVIIGAMLLAPLMAPIISLAMGILRMERNLFNYSLQKVIVGIVLALSTAAGLTVLFPYQPVTVEMLGRLNPTVLDLGVAIVAGVAGAYTKSYKEILQSLAGVAIAVALVPPLATAGIGIGRGDFSFFSQAFLLFSTNFVGIVLAATYTFRVLGFSPVVRDKKGLLVICLFFCLITIPLFLAYQDITEKSRFEKSWKVERFLVNGKYLIVQNADLKKIHNSEVLTVELLARDQLSRSDLNEFKRKVKKNFSDDLIVRARIIYIP